jgi:hypothetical protein
MRLKSIITENDFVAYAPAGLTKTTEATTIAANTYAWNDTLKAVHVNDASSSAVGYFRLGLGYLKVGDVVTISSEIWNISGHAEIALDYNVSSVVGSGGGNYLVATSEGDSGGGFESLEVTYTIVRDAYYSVPFGINTANVGEFYVRNCVVKMDTKYSEHPKKYKQGRREYTLNGVNGVYSLLTAYGFDTCSFAIDTVNKKLTITHDKPFATKAGMPIFQFDRTGNSTKFFARYGTPLTNTFDLYIYDIATNTLQDPSTIAGSIQFTAVCFGYDNEVDAI